MSEAFAGHNFNEKGAEVAAQIYGIFSVPPYQEGVQDDRDSANLDARIRSAIERGDMSSEGTLGPAMRDGMDPNVVAVLEHLLRNRLASAPEDAG